MRDLRIIDIDDGFIETMPGRRTAGGRGGCRPNGLWIQMNDYPSQIVVIDHIIGPDDRSNDFLPATYAGDYALTHVGIITFWTIVRIMQPCNGKPDHDRQPHTAITHWFLQDHEAAGMQLLIRNDTAKGDFASKGVQCILRIEDWFINPEDFELLQIHAA